MVVVSSYTGGEEDVGGIFYPQKLGIFLPVSQQLVIPSTNGHHYKIQRIKLV